MAASNEVEDQIVASIRRTIRAIDLQSRRLQGQHNLTGPQLCDASRRTTARRGLDQYPRTGCSS